MSTNTGKERLTMNELLIRDGQVVLPTGVERADVLVRGGVIAAIGADLPDHAAETVDAGDAYVLPGGIDPHVHFDSPQGPYHTCDDFSTGTAAAAFGGTTTVVQFCIQEHGERFERTIARWHDRLSAAPPYVDVGFHLLITDLGSGTLEDLVTLPDQGVTTFKVFMAGAPSIAGSDVFKVMQAAAGCGARVMTHAEDGAVIDVLINQALAAGHVEPRWHAETRPAATETAAVLRALEFARITGASLYIVHVTAGASVQAIARARAEGIDVVGETCPQYLLLDPSCLDGPLEQSAPMVFTPPPRAEPERRALWRALSDGDLEIVSSDHNAFLVADKLGAADFTAIPQGLPAVESRIKLLHHHGVRGGALSWEQFAELTAGAAARHLGLWPFKGVLAPGSDADILVFDPNRRERLSASSHHMVSDHSPYEGMEVVGSPRTVIVRGRVVVHDGQLRAEPGWGRYLPRQRRRV